MDTTTARFYQDYAQDIAARYESVESPVAKYFPLAFVSGGRVLNIGAGSGRNLTHLLRSGFDAASAMRAMRALLKPHGRMLLSLPLLRGEGLMEQCDANGRLFEGYTAKSRRWWDQASDVLRLT